MNYSRLMYVIFTNFSYQRRKLMKINFCKFPFTNWFCEEIFLFPKNYRVQIIRNEIIEADYQ